jgi:hypothetical protein
MHARTHIHTHTLTCPQVQRRRRPCSWSTVGLLQLVRVLTARTRLLMRAAARSLLGAGYGARESALHRWGRRVYVDSAHVWRCSAPRAAAPHRLFISSLPALGAAGDEHSTAAAEGGGDAPATDSRERRERPGHGSVVFGGGAGSEIEEGQRFMAVDAEVRRGWRPTCRCRGVYALGTRRLAAAPNDVATRMLCRAASTS